MLCDRYINIKTNKVYSVCGYNDNHCYLDLVDDGRLCNMKVVSNSELQNNFIKVEV